jgi:hypothetical protein
MIRYRIFYILIVLLLLSGSVFAQPAQEERPRYANQKPLRAATFPYRPTPGSNKLLTNWLQQRAYDHNRRFHLGFVFSLTALDYRMTSSQNPINSNTFNNFSFGYADVSALTPAFGVSMLMDIRITQLLSFRLQVGPTFGSRDITFWGTEDSTKTKTMRLESVLVEMPLLLKYKAVRTSDVRPYILTGLTPYVDVSAFRKFNEEKGIFLGLNPFDIAFNIGIGCDFYFEYFKFAIEAKYTTGFFNNISHKSLTGYEKYPAVITKSLAHSFVLSFLFE